MRLVTALLGALVVIGLAPSAAHALTCAPPQPAPMLRASDAAFVGRLVGVTPDRWVFAVDEALKGELGATVEVRRNAVGFFRPPLGEQIGLVLQRDPDGVFSATDCSRLDPAGLRAAAADPGARCAQPRIRSLRFRQPGRLDIALGGLDDPRTSVTVDWGDGSRTTRRVRSDASRRTVVLRHRYQEPGRHRVKVSVAALPVLACGSRAERTQHAPIVART